MTDREKTRTAASLPPLHCEGRDGHHSCRACPACGTEECRMNQELGMYCDTQIAASEAPREKRRRKSSAEMARPARQNARAVQPHR